MFFFCGAYCVWEKCVVDVLEDEYSVVLETFL